MSEQDRMSRWSFGNVEWFTLALIIACYAGWLAAIFWLPQISLLMAMAVTGILVAFHASLIHEVLHGHPFQSRRANEATVFPALNLFIPYNRFRDTHLAHHRNAVLTDPYDDPETNFLDPARWVEFPAWRQALYQFNNTLLGRIVIGPLIGQIFFTKEECVAMRRGDQQVLLAWALHVPAVIAVLWIVSLSPMPVWAYILSAYIGLGILKIRTFLEHRAHEKSRARSVIIEDNGPLAWLFLYNSLHVVHHMHPGAPWYELPRLYRQSKDRYLACNDVYVFRSYGEIFRKYSFRTKDPVAHPLWPQQ